MLRENREYERKAVVPPTDEPCFYVEVGPRSYPFEAVHDVSVSGAGIELSVALTPTTPVRLGFEQEDCQVQVQGTVMWCEPNGNEDSYRLGVLFDPHDMKNSSILFLALREFIDPFGQN